MIENMKVEFGRTSDIDSWMRLVRKVSWNFPGLETEQSIDEHKIIVLKFMNDKRALCVKNEQDIVDVLLYSRKHNMICCLAVDPAYRKRGIASILLKEALDKLDRDKDITVPTFRENDVKGITPRKLYKQFGFEEGEKVQQVFSDLALKSNLYPYIIRSASLDVRLENFSSSDYSVKSLGTQKINPSTVSNVSPEGEVKGFSVTFNMPEITPSFSFNTIFKLVSWPFT